MLLQMVLSDTFLCQSNIPLHVCTASLTIQLSGTFGLLSVLAIVNSAAMNIGCVYPFSECMPKTGIAGSQGSSIFSF